MKKDRARQLLTIFSLFMLLVLPTAIVGFNNFSSLVNQAFAKPFQKEEATFLVQTESSANIAKGSQFSLKVITVSNKELPLKHFAAFVEFDKTKIDVKAIQLQNTKLLKVMAYQNGFLIYPATMAAPTNFASLNPDTCSTANTCDFSQFSSSSISFTVNGILLSELTAQQRPIKITLVGAAETKSVAIWNEKILLPELKLGEYVKNSAPTITSEPAKYTHEGQSFLYEIGTTDADKDPVTLSLTCPDSVFCSKVQKAPEGLTLEGNLLDWQTPIYRLEPYEITVYVNDGKSVSTQSFMLQVLQKDTSYFACTFTPALSVRVLDYRVETPLTIVAESSADLVKATVTLSKDNNVEKTFDYTFTPATKNIILDQSSKPALAYKFNEGQYTGKATFTSNTGTTFTCELNNPTISYLKLVKQALSKTVSDFIKTVQAQTGVTVGTNSAPTFTTDPMVAPGNGGSSPGVSFVYGNAYSFNLIAQDIDGDPLQHTIVTKPSWATVAVASSNSSSGPSSYSIQFNGTPQAKNAGSNLFSVSVNDGYGHYITRTWVINIDYPNNDIPRVIILEPLSPIRRYQGSAFNLRWDVEDRQQVVGFSIQYTKSLASTARTTLHNNVSYKMRGMIINTASIPPGDYYFIVTATDSFSPPATGYGYTALVQILPPKPKPTPTPTPKPTAKPTPKPTTTGTATPIPTATTTETPTPTPTLTPSVTVEPTPEVDELTIQITSPKSQAQVLPQDFQSVITFQASKEGELTKAALSIKLDGVEISDKFTLSSEKGKTITASYKPNVLLEPGIHELVVSAKDTKLKEKETKISFTVLEDPGKVDNSVNFLGFDIPKNLYTIFVVSLILIVILVLMPLILYFAFRNSDKGATAPVQRKPVLPVDPSGNPVLRTPNASFAQTSQPTVTNASNVSTFQPVRVGMQNQPAPTPIPNDIPRVSQQAALDSFVANASMQEAKPTVAPTTPAKATTQLNGPVFTGNMPNKPTMAPVQKTIQAPLNLPPKTVMEVPKQVPQPIGQVPMKHTPQPEPVKPAPMLAKPAAPQTSPVPVIVQKPVTPVQQPASIPGMVGSTSATMASKPVEPLPRPMPSQPPIPVTNPPKAAETAPTMVAPPKIEMKPPTVAQTNLPPESPSIPGLNK